MSRTPHSVGAGPRGRAVRLALVAGVAALALTGCGLRIPRELNMPHPVTQQGSIMYDLWNSTWLAAWIVGALVWGLLLWCVVAYRKRSEEMPEQTRYNIPIELMYTVVPTMIVGVLFFFTATDESQITSLSAKPAQVVNVVGYRWSWTFNYQTENTYDIGTPVEYPQLYLPVNQVVRFNLTSPDVNHSFWVPAFLFKMDLIPGRQNSFQITPTTTGTFAGRCAELCGVDHSQMLFTVHVVSDQAFQQHMSQLRAEGQSGQLSSGRVQTNVSTANQGRTTIGSNG